MNTKLIEKFENYLQTEKCGNYFIPKTIRKRAKTRKQTKPLITQTSGVDKRQKSERDENFCGNIEVGTNI
ncbi:MAG: hypothetical protein K6C10_09875 [Prevotella sp.]|nr:hypothetical protein [Prevotella sp.]